MGFGEQGNKVIFFSGKQGNKGLKIRVQGNTFNFGKQGRQKIKILFLGTREQGHFFE